MKKILIANRGEIAVRVIRACHEMGIETVAVFSDVDRTSTHVLLASEAYFIGPAPSVDSYLNEDKILQVAKEANVDSIHPGYGFLSENAEFARAVTEAGLIWIGPTPETIAMMGDKVSARDIAFESGVSVIPGSKQPVTNIEEAKNISQSIGFPVLLKAVGGGGGKGMRIVNSPKKLSDALRGAMSEANSAFADDRIFIEKYLQNPRHIEIQVVADTHGNVVAMTERECSIQRRYQKIIEESPSMFINRDVWTQMADDARKIASRCCYVGVGTVEFLLDRNQNIYFLEMNTRLQVEHPITEMITGIDLVREQIRVATGKKLSLPDEIKYHGHAIECRIYAEDGFANFIPSTGTIVALDIPGGLGVRFDHGIQLNQEITPFYDPLLGKLVTWGENRSIAITRMKLALKECRIVGIDTTIPFCHAVLDHPQFVSGCYDTDFLTEELESLKKINTDNRQLHSEAVSFLTAMYSSEATSRRLLNGEAISTHSRWKIEGRKDALQ